MTRPNTSSIDRRSFMAYFSAAGIGGTAFPAALLARIGAIDDITPEIVADAAEVAGLEFTPEERELMIDGLEDNLRNYQELRTVSIPNSTLPSIRFDPAIPGRNYVDPSAPASVFENARVDRPGSDAAIAFLPVTQLAALIRTRQISSEELTAIYLERLHRHNETLECVITFTEDLALRQARAADAEIARGRYRGPLHGIPWGAKDLLAVSGYPTTWGAQPFAEQVIDSDAAVVRKLEEAGAVLIAKLTLGALAWGDVWFGGMTKNPWNPDQGSSGSSAGPAAATAAGLVGFSIGSETLGSIVSPSTRCGVTGLRPTFGAVSRDGAMALSWTMDKLGPICRSAEDCAMVFDAIRGPDGRDPTVVSDIPFSYDASRDPRRLRVGYYRSAFEADHRTKTFDDEALRVLRSTGFDLIPVELPDSLPVSALGIILSAEAAAAFDDLTRNGADDRMVRQIANAWPNVFRHSRFIPAVEYIQANRLRTVLMGQWDQLMEDLDVIVAPSFGGNLLMSTNLTGHPAVVIPNGFRDDGTPVSITFVGKLYGEAAALSVARAYQDATGHHNRIPPGFGQV